MGVGPILYSKVNTLIIITMWFEKHHFKRSAIPPSAHWKHSGYIESYILFIVICIWWNPCILPNLVSKHRLGLPWQYSPLNAVTVCWPKTTSCPIPQQYITPQPFDQCLDFRACDSFCINGKRGSSTLEQCGYFEFHLWDTAVRAVPNKMTLCISLQTGNRASQDLTSHLCG